MLMSMVRQTWKRQYEVLVNGLIPLTFYRSKRSALAVALAETPGPMVKGIMAFATETNSDEGLPHTLEHLVFMGSHNYPYKGVLDVIANRCLASGTNACTDQDHTMYTLKTVGQDGFLKILPIYLDHLLSPTLTLSQYHTEVHHINGEGEDAGVVYSEMQDHESEMESMVNRKVKELLYPPNSSYRVSTGGRLAAIRNGCSNEKVKDYHSQFYHLNNLLIAVCGKGCGVKVDPDKLLESIESIEERELSKIPKHFVKPFQTKVMPVTAEQRTKIDCPSNDEDMGVVEMAWLSHPASDLYTTSALVVLFDYLSDTSVAPLRKDFVQTEDPYASSVSTGLVEQERCEIQLHFSGVPKEKLSQIRDRFFNKTVADHCKPGFFDMERMGFVIDQAIKNQLSKTENNPASQIFNALVGHQLYGKGYEQGGEDAREDLATRLNEVDQLKKLKKEPEEFWVELFKKTFPKESVCVEGSPSLAAVDAFAQEEEERIEKQREQLGEDGLNKCEQEIEAAITANSANKPTDTVLADLIVREFPKLNLFDVEPTENELPQEGSKKAEKVRYAVDAFPLPTVLHNVKSEFVEAVILIDTSSIPLHLRHYMMLLFELAFNSPAMVEGQRLGYEEVSKLATRDLLSHSISVGVSGCYDPFVSVRLRVDAPNYGNLVKWAEIYLKNILFEPDRIAVCAKKLANLAAEPKRDGSSVAAYLSTCTTYLPEANSHFYNYISLEQFHKRVAQRIESGQGDQQAEVIAQLEAIRSALLSSPANLHVLGNEGKIIAAAGNAQKAAAGWDFLTSKRETAETKGVTRGLFMGTPNAGQTWKVRGAGRVAVVGGSESSFLIQKSEFPEDWKGDSVMETVLLAQYLSQCEGPLWCGVRGAGLVYGADIYVVPDRKSLTLSLYRCSQIGKAYEQTKKVVMEVANANCLDKTQFEAAKRSLVCDLIGAQGTLKAATQESIMCTIRDVVPKFQLELCRRIWHAKEEDVLAKGRQHLLNLFDDSKCVRSVAVTPSKLPEVQKAFPGIQVVKIEDLQLGSQK